MRAAAKVISVASSFATVRILQRGDLTQDQLYGSWAGALVILNSCHPPMRASGGGL